MILDSRRVLSKTSFWSITPMGMCAPPPDRILTLESRSSMLVSGEARVVRKSRENFSRSSGVYSLANPAAEMARLILSTVHGLISYPLSSAFCCESTTSARFLSRPSMSPKTWKKSCFRSSSALGTVYPSGTESLSRTAEMSPVSNSGLAAKCMERALSSPASAMRDGEISRRSWNSPSTSSRKTANGRSPLLRALRLAWFSSFEDTREVYRACPTSRLSS